MLFNVLLSYVLLFRNAVAQTIEQKLLYVGDESGKLLALRDIIHKVFSVIFTYLGQLLKMWCSAKQ
jgi:hypothetical protein